MVDTGLEAYRFSISWSRLLPNGRGPVNPKGLQYYNNLINQLITNGIQPHVSLHHYDLPQVLEDEYGGWVSRDIIRDFTDYADVCFREFGDRVLYWTTVSEPNVFSVGGYDQGTCPPQRCSPPFCFIKSNRGNSTYEPYLAIHHILLAHSSVVRLYRRKYSNKQHGFVGISIFLFGLLPQTNTEKDRAATQRVRDFLVGWVMEPLQYGDYPISMKKNAGERIPAFTTRESEQLKGSFDFIGLIHYTNVNITDNSDVLKNQLRDFGADMAANTSQRTPSNSSLQDVSRVKYLHEYIGGVLDALRDGVNIKGYFSWSFMDLYELLEGYEATYGLYYVDRDDPELKRHPKLSAKWYSRLLKNRSTSIVGTVELEKDPSLVSIGHLFE
ncbi:Hydroxyisourate hydrolase [Vigna angularis]|uniref:Hydroxyisourate hydrolase n=2 Tax=Phaseolus angularis TaxID=3914 RepID=A0A8T0KXF8_PHAAN|nr:Hydroxyisourate hydrolase [Vigna angularis]